MKPPVTIVWFKRDLRVAEVVQLDLVMDAKGRVEAYRAKLKVSFKFEGS